MPYPKILSFFLAFGPYFVILSISIEGLFYLSYSATLIAWIEVEAALRPARSEKERDAMYKFGGDDIRIALFFLFFVQIAFFGTGKWVIVSVRQTDWVLIGMFSVASIS
jgi:GPI ethanolamine phosphate transferase 1